MNKPFFMDEKEFQALQEAQGNANKVEEEQQKVEEKVVEEPVKEEKIETKDEIEKSPVLEEKSEDIKVENLPTKEAIETDKGELKHEIVKSKLEKPTVEKEQEKKGFVMDLKLFTTIFCCIIVAYLFLTLARNLYFGFKYYDYAHGNKGTNTVEPQK